MPSGSERGGRSADGPVLPITRAIAVVILPFLVVAVVLLFGFPTRTGELFAWPIDPPLSAYLLASAYVGGIWFFVRVVIAREWHTVRHGFPAVVVFAAALLVATLLHLDKFSHNLSFAVWLVLYITTPFAVAWAWWLQRRSGRAAPDAAEVRVAGGIRILLLVVGACALVCGAALFVAPAAIGPMWAWPLTPLTGQVTGAVLSLPGVVAAGVLVDDRWSALRVLLQSQLVSVAAIIVSLVLGGAALQWDRPAAFGFVALVGVAAVFYTAVTVRMEIVVRRVPASRQ